MRRIFPLFALLVVGCIYPQTKTDAAAVKAEQLLVYAKTWSNRNDGQKLESLDVLIQYAEEGERAIIDPWGQTFRFSYVIEPETQEERLVIWTTEPKSGRVVAVPRQLASLVDPSK